MNTRAWRLHRLLVPIGVALALFGCTEQTTTKSTTTTTADSSVAANSTNEKAIAGGAPVDERVRIGTWNIEWLGTPENRSGPAKGIQQKPEDLADYIIAANVSILALEEIARDDADDSWTNSILTQTFQLVNQKTGGNWTHRLSPANSGRNQVVGIAWDAAKVHPLDKMKPALETGPNSEAGTPVWSRPPPAITFNVRSGYTDFVVIAIHMKSNYGGSGGKFVAHRGAEAKALVDAVHKTYQDGDLIIIGDSNCASHNEPAPQTFETAGWIDLNAKDQKTFWQGDGALDRIFIPKNQPEFADRHFEVFRDAYLTPRNLTTTEFKKRFSDHFMVITDVHIMKDDD